MKTTVPIPVLLLASCTGVFAQTAITSGHIDLGVAYEDGVLLPHIHDEANDLEYEPGDAVLVLGANTRTTAPGTGSFSFLGPAGLPVWILPAAQTPGRISLGIGTEEIEAGAFRQDSISLGLVGMTGPGQFAAYTVNGFGAASAAWNTTDGIDEADFVLALAGGHSHYNFAFTAPGDYTVSIQASGVLADGVTAVRSDIANFRFAVVPEPSTDVLMTLGTVALGGATLLTRRHGRGRIS